MVIYKLRDWIPSDKIDFYYLSKNPNSISILEKNIDQIDWYNLPLNPNAMSILEKNIDKINWKYLSANSSIFIYDYQSMQKHFYDTYGKELIETLYNPKNFHKFGKDHWNIDEDL